MPLSLPPPLPMLFFGDISAILNSDAFSGEGTIRLLCPEENSEVFTVNMRRTCGSGWV
jgi:hypothetical protein